jgi:alkaline phosphatase
MVSDGMSMGVPSLADPFSRLVRGTGTRWFDLLGSPDVAQGFFDTRSLNSMVTDSAAASTAWGSGTRVFNGSINVLPDGTELTPLAPLVRDTGRRVGLVTTTTVTHATPAGFAAVQAVRDDEHLIAPQYAGLVDVVMGGGRNFYDAKLRRDGRDVIEDYREAGYTFLDTREQVVGGIRPAKALGLFSRGHMPYTIDQLNLPAGRARVPTLAEMTQLALDVLSTNGEGFLLQVEGGRVDHAAHANDAATILWDQIAFDDAIAVVHAFTQKHPDTLVIVTTDHGNANPGLNGVGSRYRDSTLCFERVASATASYESLLPRVKPRGQVVSTDDLRSLLSTASGLKLSKREVELVRAALDGDWGGEISRQQHKAVAILGQVLGNHTGIGWTGVTHTSDLALISAWGPGSERFQGLLLNVDAYTRLAELLGITHRNPSMSQAQARQFATAVREERRPHWA